MAHTHQMRAQLRASWRKGRQIQSQGDGSGPQCDVRHMKPFSSGHATGTSVPVTRIVASDNAILRDRDRFLTQAEAASLSGAANPCDTILRIAGALAQQHLLAGRLDSILTVALNDKLDKLGEMQGACERLATTPLPLPYTLLVHRTAYLYILLAPLAMAADMGYYTALFNAILAYTFFGLDELARQVRSRVKLSETPRQNGC